MTCFWIKSRFCCFTFCCCASFAPPHLRARRQGPAVRPARLNFEVVVSFFHHDLWFYLKLSVTKVPSIFLRRFHANLTLLSSLFPVWLIFAAVFLVVVLPSLRVLFVRRKDNLPLGVGGRILNLLSQFCLNLQHHTRSSAAKVLSILRSTSAYA